MTDFVGKPSTKCRYWLMEHYDSVIHEIDMFVENKLSDQTKAETNSKVTDRKVASINVDKLQQKRVQEVERIHMLENKTLTHLMDIKDELDKHADLDELEIKRRLYKDNYCFLVKKINSKSKKIERLILVIDSFIEKKYIKYLHRLINPDRESRSKGIEYNDEKYIYMQRIKNTLNLNHPNDMIQVCSKEQLLDIQIMFFNGRGTGDASDNDEDEEEEEAEQPQRQQQQRDDGDDNDDELVDPVEDEDEEEHEEEHEEEDDDDDDVDGQDNILESLYEYYKINEEMFAKRPNLVKASVLCRQALTLTNESENIFKNFENIKYLAIHYAGIESKHAHMFNRLTSLKYLDIEMNRNNRCNDMNETIFDALTSLACLRLCYFDMPLLNPRMFAHLTNLNRLELPHNRIIDLYEGTFENLTNLEHLNLSSNGLQTVRQSMFRGLGRLVLLDLSSNQIEHIDEGAFEGINLNLLGLDENKLMVIPERTLPASLRSLELSRNFITKASFGAFQNLSDLVFLTLKGNRNRFVKEDRDSLYGIINSNDDLAIDMDIYNQNE